MKRSRQARLKRLDNAPIETIEAVAENMKERVYATITLLAVITALWQSANEHTAIGALASIVGTAVALWLATLVAARMSHHAIRGRGMTMREVKKLLFSSSGLFAPVLVPAIFIFFSMTGRISLRTALFTGVISLLLSLFLLSYYAGRRIHTNTLQLVLMSSFEFLLGVGVIALKILVGE